MGDRTDDDVSTIQAYSHRQAIQETGLGILRIQSNDLKGEILAEILRFLKKKEAINQQFVCRAWKEYMQRSITPIDKPFT